MRKRILKVNEPTQTEFDSIAFIQQHTGVVTTSRAAVEAINSYKFHVMRIKELERQIEELNNWKLNTMDKVDNYFISLDALRGIIKKK
ncbi:hypothetical protein M2451_003876 [Dysgonomonas sp. PFB1-18]|uniref:hypothetical protein n=1 Tax=unclassified Dysgonomonas TaxID=2630389 RepID=UPI0024763A64|nr:MULTISPECIES: hypothetical protein [unclassified Dysgonomonas]MDH6311209.1 hypothetical protein [Dysgonomonas sp. PF1-14]MDH6341099.1 hypothetical protein [Dysgonomonas sp. PF1-16]MDH6382535.1 hypothetical protein [Dysgonomonas sp. PFB1-18]MDH6399931.1 hypothetical protein [Dysgonomonas sp. PF1-23]